MATETQTADQAAPRWTWYLILAVALAACSGLLFGHDTGVISGALLFLKGQFHLTAFTKEIVTATVLLGAAVGAAVSGRLADDLGRRKLILAFGVIFCAGSAGTALAQNFPWLVACRFVVGFAIGGASLVGPLYIAEISPRQIRGALVFLNQLAITLGILLAYLIDLGFASVPQGWRAMFAVGVVPAGILFVGMLFLPDSPRYLLERGRREEATGVLRRVRGNPPKDVLERDVEGIVTRVREKGGFRELLKPDLKLALLVGVALAVFQQVTGINTIIYYAPTILQQVGTAGHGPTAAILGGVEIAAVNFLATIVAVFLVDRVGRRVLLLTGMGIMALSLGALGAALLVHGVLHTAPYVVVVCLMVYVIGFAIGLGPVFWLLIAEIYPLRVRGTAMSIATVANWVANLVVALTFLTSLKHIGNSGTFFLYGVLCLAGIAFVARFVPETKGRSLEEIEDIWEARAGEEEPGARRQPGRPTVA